eukprot:scaffold44943_cov62-Phaeocystis_antarctica.AAC.2
MVELSVAKGLFRGYTPAPASPPRGSTSCEARLVLRSAQRSPGRAARRKRTTSSSRHRVSVSRGRRRPHAHTPRLA